MRAKLGLFILRVSLGVVFLVFGIGKFEGNIWTQTIRTMYFFQSLPWNPNVSVYLIGLLEVLTGIFLIVGLFTRLVSAIAALQLIGILTLFNFQEIKDIGLLGAAIYLTLVKADYFGVDALLASKRTKA